VTSGWKTWIARSPHALDAVPDPGKPTRAAFLKVVEGHVVGSGELLGTYEDKKK